jgi:hypothetical protein
MECPQTGYLIGHHQALAGGNSISQLQTTAELPCDATKSFGVAENEVPPAKAWWLSQNRLTELFVAEKLKDHRLKPGGVES